MTEQIELETAKRECFELIEKIESFQNSGEVGEYGSYPSQKRAAVKRKSMDLTRSLAVIRNMDSRNWAG